MSNRSCPRGNIPTTNSGVRLAAQRIHLLTEAIILIFETVCPRRADHFGSGISRSQEILPLKLRRIHILFWDFKKFSMFQMHHSLILLYQPTSQTSRFIQKRGYPQNWHAVEVQGQHCISQRGHVEQRVPITTASHGANCRRRRLQRANENCSKTAV